jgi:hypothetical protein
MRHACRCAGFAVPGAEKDKLITMVGGAADDVRIRPA